MISYIKGKVLETGPRYAIIDTGHLGYKVNLTDDLALSLIHGAEIALWTHFVVREDTQDLYGFKNKNDREIFNLLISISGIGPKSALNIMSLISSETLVSAIRTGSTAHMVKVSGIGKKTAEKIIIELKDKLSGFADSGFSKDMHSDADAIEALKSLGYDPDEAREALKKIDKSVTDTSAKIKAALKLLA